MSKDCPQSQRRREGCRGLCIVSELQATSLKQFMRVEISCCAGRDSGTCCRTIWTRFNAATSRRRRTERSEVLQMIQRNPIWIQWFNKKRKQTEHLCSCQLFMLTLVFQCEGTWRVHPSMKVLDMVYRPEAKACLSRLCSDFTNGTEICNTTSLYILNLNPVAIFLQLARTFFMQLSFIYMCINTFLQLSSHCFAATDC